MAHEHGRSAGPRSGEERTGPRCRGRGPRDVDPSREKPASPFFPGLKDEKFSTRQSRPRVATHGSGDLTSSTLAEAGNLAGPIPQASGPSVALIMSSLGRSRQPLEHHSNSTVVLTPFLPRSTARFAPQRMPMKLIEHLNDRTLSSDATNCPVRSSFLALTLCWSTHSRFARSLSDICDTPLSSSCSSNYCNLWSVAATGCRLMSLPTTEMVTFATSIVPPPRGRPPPCPFSRWRSLQGSGV